MDISGRHPIQCIYLAARDAVLPIRASITEIVLRGHQRKIGLFWRETGWFWHRKILSPREVSR
jgi:hypothetical protein